MIGAIDIRFLTVHEYHVVAYAAKGYRYKEIARFIKRSPKTVEKHINNVKAKYNIRGGIAWMRMMREFPGP